MDPLGIGQANCFRTHNELTMGLLGKCPLAPSVVLFQWESLSELVYTQQTQILALRDCWDVVDLTLDSDSEDSAMPVESIAKAPRPVVRDSDRSLIPIEEGHSVGKQCCIHSLGLSGHSTRATNAYAGLPESN